MKTTQPHEGDSTDKEVTKHINALMEHFDTIQVFGTRETEEGTQTYTSGAGNWYARYGQVKEWMIKQDEFVRINCREE